MQEKKLYIIEHFPVKVGSVIGWRPVDCEPEIIIMIGNVSWYAIEVRPGVILKQPSLPEVIFKSDNRDYSPELLRSQFDFRAVNMALCGQDALHSYCSVFKPGSSDGSAETEEKTLEEPAEL
jgi:hypothetical protein